MQTVKQAAQQLIEQVSDQASWDDIMYDLYVKQKLEKGLKAVTGDRWPYRVPRGGQKAVVGQCGLTGLNRRWRIWQGFRSISPRTPHIMPNNS